MTKPLLGESRELTKVLAEAQRRLFDDAIAVTGWEAATLARKAGIAPSTLNRKIKGDDPSIISSTKLAQLTRAIRKQLAEVQAPPVIVARWNRALARWFSTTGLDRSTFTHVVIGYVQAGQWRQAMQWEDADDSYEVDVPVRPVYIGKTFGLEVRGRSMDQIYPEGTVAICVRYVDLDREPRSGEDVVCERRSKDGLVETTIKRYKVEDSGQKWLLPQTSDPALAQPISLEQAPSDVESIEILAVVVGSYRHNPVID